MSALIKSIGQNPCKFITGPGGGKFLYPALLFLQTWLVSNQAESFCGIYNRMTIYPSGLNFLLYFDFIFLCFAILYGTLLSQAHLIYTQRKGDLKMAEAGNKRPRRTPQERANELDEKITKINQSINELEEKKKAVMEEYDAKITAAKERIKSLEAKKQEILAPKPPRKTKKQKIQEIVKLAMKNGMSVEEIAGQLHVEVEN